MSSSSSTTNINTNCRFAFDEFDRTDYCTCTHHGREGLTVDANGTTLTMNLRNVTLDALQHYHTNATLCGKVSEQHTTFKRRTYFYIQCGVFMELDYGVRSGDRVLCAIRQIVHYNAVSHIAIDWQQLKTIAFVVDTCTQ